MQNIQKTRFLAANYTNLQGLKSVPLGLLLVMVVIWANFQGNSASGLVFPILLSVLMIIMFAVIQRYYLTHYGKIERTDSQKLVELILGVLGGVGGLVAFVLDVRFNLKFSFLGLIFAFAIVGEYLRMQWYATGRYLLPLSAASFVMMFVVSVLPFLGLEKWWLLMGLRSQLFGVLAVAGLIMIVNGLFGHWFFVHQLPGREE